MDFYTSDLHLGHSNILKHCNRPFDSVEQMDRALITNINNTVGMNDDLYILGDFTCYGVNRQKAIEYRNKVICKNIYLIYGNHDKNFDGLDTFKWCGTYKEVKHDKGKFVLFHYPISEWNNKFHGSIHLHGHSHNVPEYNQNNLKNGLLRYDVGVDANDFKPISSEEILNFFKLIKTDWSS